MATLSNQSRFGHHEQEEHKSRAPLHDVVIVIAYAPEPSQMASGSLHGRAMTPPVATAAIAQVVSSVIAISAMVTCPFVAPRAAANLPIQSANNFSGSD
jgi:hypothetical protein